VFAYVMPTYKGAPYVTVQGLIDLRKKQLMQLDKASSIDIEQAAAPSANKVSTVTIMRYATPSLPRYERVAYLEDSRTIFAVVLSAASPELLQQNSRFIDDLIATHQRTIAAAKP